MNDLSPESSSSALKPFAQAKLLSATEKCKICGDQAARHIHYGAMSCFSCRAFFRRSIQNKTAQSYACRRFNECDVNLRTRKNCQACRYNKCLEVGMKPTWVLTEEERKVRFKKSDTTKSSSSGRGGRTKNGNSGDRQPRHSHEDDDENDDSGMMSMYNMDRKLDDLVPAFPGFIHQPQQPDSDDEQQNIGNILNGSELLVGQGRIQEIKEHVQASSSIPQDVLTSVANRQHCHGPLTRPEILLKKDPDFSPVNGSHGMGRPTVLKIKDEPTIDLNFIKAAGSAKENMKESPSTSGGLSSQLTTSQCSVITQNLDGMLDCNRSHEIRDVLKDDPDFNNIDIDLIDASLMDDDGRQLKITDGDGIGMRTTTLGINDIVAHLSKNYDFPVLEEDTNLEENGEDEEYNSKNYLSAEDEIYLNNLVKTHDEQYRTVNFGEEMIKEMMMCSMFGIPISYNAAINGYKLCVERMFKIARSLAEFETLTHNDKEILLKVNVDLLVCLRGAIFFDPRKSGKQQVLVSMGDQDIELLHTMFSQAMKEEANMKHIEYKTFNSVQDVRQNEKEERYKMLQERVGRYLEDGTVTVLVSFIVLFSSDSLHAALTNQENIMNHQNVFIVLLEKYLNTKYGRLDACLQIARCMEAVSMLREMADFKKSRHINTTFKV